MRLGLTINYLKRKNRGENKNFVTTKARDKTSKTKRHIQIIKIGLQIKVN